MSVIDSIHMITSFGYENAGKIFNELLASAQDTVVKVGVRNDYAHEDNSESWQAWQNRRYKQSEELAHQDKRYQDWIRVCKQLQAQVVRIQITDTRPSAYTEWTTSVIYPMYEEEFAEQVLLTPRRRLGGLVLPKSDIVCIDEDRVLRWIYQPRSTEVIGCHVWDARTRHTDKPAVEALNWTRKQLQVQSVPLQDYSSHPRC